MLDWLSAESARLDGAIPIARSFSSSVCGISSNCLGSGFRGSYIVGGRLRAGGGTIAWYPWLIPSDDAVGSNEQLSLARTRIHAWIIAVIVLARRIKLPVPVVTTRPRLSGRIIVNIVRSAESAVSRRIRLKLIMLNAKLRVQPNDVIMALIESISRGIRTALGMSSRRTIVERMTKRQVRNAMEACRAC
jgi:hypothetical protein